MKGNLMEWDLQFSSLPCIDKSSIHSLLLLLLDLIRTCHEIGWPSCLRLFLYEYYCNKRPPPRWLGDFMSCIPIVIRTWLLCVWVKCLMLYIYIYIYNISKPKFFKEACPVDLDFYYYYYFWGGTRPKTKVDACEEKQHFTLLSLKVPKIFSAIFFPPLSLSFLRFEALKRT
jgi:hypothetical protein